MGQPSYFNKAPTAQIFRPDRLILDTARPARQMWRKINSVPLSRLELYSQENLIRLVFQALTYDSCAEEQLGYLSLALVDDIGYCDRSQVDTHCWRELEADAGDIANALHQFGSHVHMQLRGLRAYESGYLHYLFENWLGDDVVLHKLELPLVESGSNRYGDAYRQTAYTPLLHKSPFAPI